jgi:hypothetical protein
MLLFVDALHTPDLEAFHKWPADVLQHSDFLGGQKLTKLTDGEFIAVGR